MKKVSKIKDGKHFAHADDYIEYWHTHDTGNTLREFLGFTESEYEQWMKTGEITKALGENAVEKLPKDSETLTEL